MFVILLGELYEKYHVAPNTAESCTYGSSHPWEKPFLHWRVQAVQPLGTVFELPRHYEGDVLSLLEISLDTNLALSQCSQVGPERRRPCAARHQCTGGRECYGLLRFATACTVFRLVLPHPEAIIKVGCPMYIVYSSISIIVYHSIFQLGLSWHCMHVVIIICQFSLVVFEWQLEF